MLRIRGLRGQYTRLLSDGVPLYFDLPWRARAGPDPADGSRPGRSHQGRRVGALRSERRWPASVNLLSRRPGTEPNREFLFSQSAPDATDGVLWLSSPPTGSWSSTFLVGAHRQDERDVDDDGWSDIAGYPRGVARQRVFWDNRQGKSVSGIGGRDV